MKIGANWRSGVDTNTLLNIDKTPIDVDIDKDFRYKFDNEGLLAVRGVKGKATNENISAVEISADHGFLYVASKEFFFYSDKQSILLNPASVSDAIPEYIKVALGDYQSGITNQVYSQYVLSGVPTFLTPMVVNRVTTSDYESPLIIKNTLSLDDVDRNTVTKLSKRLTGIEEPIVEIFEVDSIKTINSTENAIINPGTYVYNPFDGLIYAKGTPETILVEYEATFDKRVVLGKKFSPSRTGKEKGVLSLSSAIAKGRGDNVSTVSRRLLDIQGSTIYINQDAGDSVRLVFETRYQKEDESYVEYETLENNLEYAVIQTPYANTELFVSTVRVGKTDSAGTAIVPILGYGESGTHKSIIRSGSVAVNIYPAPSGLVAGKLRVKIYALESETIIATEDFLINKQKQNVSVASYQRISSYVPKNETSYILSETINLDNITILKLRDTYNPFAVSRVVNNIQLEGDTSVKLMFDPDSIEASLIFYDTLPFRVIDSSGGGNYGI